MAPTFEAPAESEPLLYSPQFEREPLVHEPQPKQRKANPYWVIPIVLVVNMARGMTLSPRINVFTDIACRAVGTDCNTPEVAARAAKVQASVLTIMNVLSSGSTGLWSQYGDVAGRKFVFYVSVLGFIAIESVFVVVSNPNSALASRGELFILLGPMLEGIAGGLSVFNGVVHAYVSDCSPDGSRSRIFSIIQGMVFVGLAIGPWVAGFLLNYTSMKVYSLFYISIGIQVALLGYIFVFPESLRTKGPPPSLETAPAATHRRTIRGQFRRFVAAFVSPITIFRPRQVERGTSHVVDYNVTLMGLAMFLYITSTAVYPIKYLYGRGTYEWDPQQLGYYLSLVKLWICRATNLFFVLPLIVKYFKPKTPITGASTPEEIASELRFDKHLAQGSLLMDACANIFMRISTSEAAFVAASCMSAFTSGGNPALHSLGAVCLFALGYGDEAGKLFGAVGVVNAISHSFSPGLFAFTYARAMLDGHPRSIFILAATLLCIAVGLLSLIRARGW
ncbi:hypothetical protein HMN09_00170700 [Mycena chlorophos]|uniref:MFS general substrate transporter n=1 Tax=Mycena chlorophos TaxID=658473 RepID=A0A8H6TQ78_MYCCL|nr:hypothetical protein HMN09_00170700 [Mycena chlorophos]